MSNVRETMRRLLPLGFVLAAMTTAATTAPPVGDVHWQIRRDAAERSSIMESLHALTDLHGPRLTGSPALDGAARWAVQQLTAWGLVNARLEPWEFGHEGWSNERLAVHVVSPVKDALVAEPLAWTPGTDGPVTAPLYHLVAPARSSERDLRAFLDGVGDAVARRIVLVGEPQAVPVSFAPHARRHEEDELRRRFDPVAPTRPSPPAREAERDDPTELTARRAALIIDEFLVARGALARIDDAAREHGQIRAFSNRTYDVSRAVPTVVMRNEDFGRLARLMGAGHTVTVEIDLVNRTWPAGRTQHNVVAEIPGTDKAEEIVMLGAHLDSWHAATGATDNAIGVAVVMEAVRILQALETRPRRTVRIALWTGEEQGLLGSRAYVREQFGTFENPEPAYHRFSGYVNIDSGTGRPRGMTVFGPAEAAAVLRDALTPLADLGVVGATHTSVRRTGSSDHTSFNAAGLPGIHVLLDPIEYSTTTWHTNLDTYERIVEDDARRAAIAAATTVYHLATRDEPLPRFRPDEMPPPGAPRDRPEPERTPERQPPVPTTEGS
jgi:carboxypeptidase Q